jgi:hypothetical protein
MGEWKYRASNFVFLLSCKLQVVVMSKITELRLNKRLTPTETGKKIFYKLKEARKL